MCKVTEEQFRHFMTQDVVKDNCCVEINFWIDHDFVYEDCWLGVMPDSEHKKPVFWFGLTPDGKEAYDYETFEQMWTAPVFHDKSLFNCWDSVKIETINGCSVESMLPFL